VNETIELPESVRQQLQVLLKRSMAFGAVAGIGALIFCFGLMYVLRPLLNSEAKYHVNWWVAGICLSIGLVIIVIALVFAQRIEKEAMAVAGSRRALAEFRMARFKPAEPDYDEEFRARLPVEKRRFARLVFLPAAITFLYRVSLWLATFLIHSSAATARASLQGYLVVSLLSFFVMLYGTSRFRRFIGLPLADLFGAVLLGTIFEFFIGLLAWPLYIWWRAKTQVKKYREKAEWEEKPELYREVHELFHGPKKSEDW
jgi:hypothetical protein